MRVYYQHAMKIAAFFRGIVQIFFMKIICQPLHA